MLWRIINENLPYGNQLFCRSANLAWTTNNKSQARGQNGFDFLGRAATEPLHARIPGGRLPQTHFNFNLVVAAA